MKLLIGENIRSFRKKNDLTQEELADRLGVTYQSISRWENGATYPDLELIPAIAETLAVTVDELLGMPQIEKERRAEETFDALRRACMKPDYDADHIVSLLRDIRRNYLGSEKAWRPWVEGEERVYQDPAILPEVRLLAEACLARKPLFPCVLQTMAVVEEEEQLEEFLKKHTTSFDCSRRELLFRRYMCRGDIERFERERRFRFYSMIDKLLSQRTLVNWRASDEERYYADQFTEDLLALVRRDAADDGVDRWAVVRAEQGINAAERLLYYGEREQALRKLESVVALLEEAMSITEEVILPASCRFLEGMECRAREEWSDFNLDPDGQDERIISIENRTDDIIVCSYLNPSRFYDALRGKEFEALQDNPEFEKPCQRVNALIVTRPKEKP